MHSEYSMLPTRCRLRSGEQGSGCNCHGKSSDFVASFCREATSATPSFSAPQADTSLHANCAENEYILLERPQSVAQVDVIIPVFNTPIEYLIEAIKSLRAQLFTDWCAWIVDDGSSDDYGAQLKAQLELIGDARIHYLYTEHKMATGSRNVAIAKGHAPYVAFLDSDDCWKPNHLSNHLAVLNKQEGISLVHGYFEVIDSDGQAMHSAPRWEGLNELSLTESFVKMLQGNFIGASTVVVRRKILEEVDGFDATFPSLGDKELWLRMLNAGAKFHYEPSASVLYRVHPGNISKNTDLLLATRRRIIQLAEKLIRENPLFSKIDWLPLEKEMTRHMFREAAEVHFAEGRYAKAIKFGAPWHSGVTSRATTIVLRSFVALIIGVFTTLAQSIAAMINTHSIDR